jgi:hypothetical protein
MTRRPGFSLYDLREHPARRGLGRSTGTRPSRGFAWRLAAEGVVGSILVYMGLTYALDHTH